jgi:putative oxidoreductase
MKIGRLLLRLAVGGFFVGHGTQKLFGWFGGHGLDATAQGFEQLGLRPGKANAIAAGAAEAGGGALLAAGLETPLASAVLTATMLTAIHRVHLKNGPWAGDGGYEYNVVLIASALALAEVGPGDLSLDAARGRERSGPGWALAALAAGALGSLGAHLAASAQPAPVPEPSENGQVGEPAAQSA